MIVDSLTNIAGRNLRERNQEVEQLKQKIRELQDAARGTPPANELAVMGSNTAWGVPPAPTQEMHFTGEHTKPDNSVCHEHENSSNFDTDQTQRSHQTPISGTVQGNANMDDFDFFTSFEDHMQSTPNPAADHSNPLSIPQDKSPIPQQNQPQPTHRLTHPRTDGTPSTVSDPTETSISPATSSSASSSSRRHTRPALMTRSSAPTLLSTPHDTSTSTSNPWNQIDPNINVPRPSLSLIHLAVAAGNADTLRLLLQDLELPVNQRDHAGYTPLQRAIMSGSTDLVTVLLENGAGAATEDESD